MLKIPQSLAERSRNEGPAYPTKAQAIMSHIIGLPLLSSPLLQFYLGLLRTMWFPAIASLGG